MRGEQYKALTAYFRRPGWTNILMFVSNRLLPVLIANVYIILGVIALLVNPLFTLFYVGVPLAVFIFVTILRRMLNYKRPYEVFEFSPLSFSKNTKHGMGFPSRHAASGAVIGIACMVLLPWVGWIILIMTLLICAGRVLSGLHFIRDVAAGFCFGLIVGLIGFSTFL